MNPLYTLIAVIVILLFITAFADTSSSAPTLDRLIREFEAEQQAKLVNMMQA